MTIEVVTSDSIIWNTNDFIIKFISAMLNNDHVEVYLAPEGPCAEQLKFYTLLDKICAEFNFNKNKIIIVTCNRLEAHPEYKIRYVHRISNYLATAKQYSTQVSTTDKKFDNNFKYFGHFIGHGNLPRLLLGSYLYNHQQDKTLQTYHCDATSDYHTTFLGLNDMISNGYTWEQVSDAVNLIKNLPLVIDKIDQYPILSPTTLNISKVYPDFFVEIVSLTYYTGNTFYTDEKIWRPIMMKTPFIIQGPQYYIDNLHKLGFRSFNQWWPEYYCNDTLPLQYTEIVDIINNLSKLSLDDIKAMYREMVPILEHNFNRMLELTGDDFDNLE